MSLRSSLAAFWRALIGDGPQGQPDNAPPSTPSPATTQTPLFGKVSREFLERAAQQPAGAERAAAFKALFPIPEPPPGIPQNEREQLKLAMDESISEIYGFANASAFGEGIGFPGYPYLAELTQRPEYRIPSETRAKEMTRKWIELEYGGDEPNDELLNAIVSEMDRFKLMHVFREAAEHDGFFGKGIIYVDVKGVRENPTRLMTRMVLKPQTIPIGSVNAFTVVEPTWVYPNNYNTTDPLAADFFKPTSWWVMGKRVHKSRLLMMVSRKMPDILKAAYIFGGLSLSQMLKPYTDNWLRARQSVSDLLHSFSIIVLMTDMMASISGDSSGASFYKKLDAFILNRDNRGVYAVDKDSEDVKNLAVPLGTLDKLQAQAQEQQCAVSQMPLVKAFGITPTGLNASSEGEIRVWYDLVHSLQEAMFRDPLTTAIDVIQLNKFGKIDPKVGFKFVSLWQLDEAGEALVRKTDADTDAVYVEAGVVDRMEVRRRLATDPHSNYAGLNFDEIPDLPDDLDEPPTGGDPARSAESTGATWAGDAAWKEGDHPRDKDGKFGQGGGSGLKVESGKTTGGAAAIYDRAAKTWAAEGIEPTRIKAMAIPPAWTDVRIAHDPDEPLQVLGRDAKGRTQYRYTAAFAASGAARKLARVAAFWSKAPALEAATAAAIERGDHTAAAVRLMLLTGMRPGSENDTGAEKKAHGATNLRKSHVQVDGDTLHYSFGAKDGVTITGQVTDAALANFATDQLERDGERLFDTDETKARAFIKSIAGGEYKSKDLRTYVANKLADETVASVGIPKTEKDRRKAINFVGDVVSKQLGNTRAMALSSYIRPDAFAAWRLEDE